MPNPARQDPVTDLRFSVEIDGTEVAGFCECFGLSSEIDVIEYREGNEPTRARKLPGLTKLSPVTLKRGLSANLELWNWHKSVVDGEIVRRNVLIVVRDAKGESLLRIRLRSAWPSKWIGPALHAQSNEVAMETLELVHEGLELES